MSWMKLKHSHSPDPVELVRPPRGTLPMLGWGCPPNTAPTHNPKCMFSTEGRGQCGTSNTCLLGDHHPGSPGTEGLPGYMTVSAKAGNVWRNWGEYGPRVVGGCTWVLAQTLCLPWAWLRSAPVSSQCCCPLRSSEKRASQGCLDGLLRLSEGAKDDAIYQDLY